MVPFKCHKTINIERTSALKKSATPAWSAPRGAASVERRRTCRGGRNASFIDLNFECHGARAATTTDCEVYVNGVACNGVFVFVCVRAHVWKKDGVVRWEALVFRSCRVCLCGSTSSDVSPNDDGGGTGGCGGDDDTDADDDADDDDGGGDDNDDDEGRRMMKEGGGS